MVAASLSMEYQNMDVLNLFRKSLLKVSGLLLNINSFKDQIQVVSFTLIMMVNYIPKMVD